MLLIVQATPPELPSLREQIAWVQERAADAAELRELLVMSDHVSGEKAARDAEMWNAVLSTLKTLASHVCPDPRAG